MLKSCERNKFFCDCKLVDVIGIIKKEVLLRDYNNLREVNLILSIRLCLYGII